MTEFEQLKKQVEILEEVVEMLGDVLMIHLPSTKRTILEGGEAWNTVLNKIYEEKK